MAKKIILCADGTGNKGGYTPDSNVYKLYNAIDLHDPDCEQIAFYDNGVGTQTAKYIRALSGALGFGFKANVCDLYEYLARNYEAGDSIYLFGFSRGAATIRAFNGFVGACGLIDGRDKSNKALKSEVKRAVKAYEKEKSERAAMLSGITIHPETPKIEFIGVWDTVSALGFPERTTITGIFMFILNYLFYIAGVIADKIIPHKFYNYELTPNVINAYQALALDDERTSFWPKVWREDAGVREHTNVDQVWFAGVHSNIGGGYERAGLANVSFFWMLNKLGSRLKLKAGILESAEADANVNGRMYDSREGFAAYYRYHPREIKTLCEEAGAPVNIHKSVMRRMKLRTANYGPKLLPSKFNLVGNQDESEPSPEIYLPHWKLFHNAINKWIFFRKWLYGILLEFTVLVMIAAGYFWLCPPESNPVDRLKSADRAADCNWPCPANTDPEPGKSLIGHVAEILEYFTPRFFDGLIEYAVVQNPVYAITAAIVFAFYWQVRKFARNMTTLAAERIRKLFITAPEKHPDY